MEDVDGDAGILFHVKTQELQLNENSTEATLTNDTKNVTPVKGMGRMNIVP